MEYTDTQKEDNYLRLKRHIKALNTERITEDLVEDFKMFLYTLRLNFPDFSNISNDIQNQQFRNIAYNTEHIYLQIEKQYSDELYFNIELYKQLLDALEYMINYSREEAELMDLMAGILI